MFKDVAKGGRETLERRGRVKDGGGRGSERKIEAGSYEDPYRRMPGV